jgi:hypothetical protein
MFVGLLFTPWAMVIGLPVASACVIGWFWPTSPKKMGEVPQEDVSPGIIGKKTEAPA